MRPKLWSGGDENALCCNSNLRNSSKNNLASAISLYAFSFPCKRASALYHPGARFWLQQLRHIGDCVPTPMRALSHSVREKFFLFSKNNPIKLFPGGIALLISTRTLHQTSGARDEVVLINQSRMHFLVQITNAVQEKSWLESFQKQHADIKKQLSCQN